ncbi:peptidoglycan-binding protein LysM [Ulvibacter sp.]|nr:peptidoglycan-binding protein LysM [Ulvibacter sp.]
MKKNILHIALIAIISALTASTLSFKKVDLSTYKTECMVLNFHVPIQSDMAAAEDEAVVFDLFLGKTYIGFKEALGFKESSGSYTVVNRFGYMGKYQFSKSTLKMIGIYNAETFMEDASLQEKAFSAYVSRNKWILRRDIKRFDGRYIGGVEVTESGILAAAHLAGAGNVKKFLRSHGADGFEDANGTSIRNYLKKFSGYDTSTIVPNRKAKVL